MSTVIPSETDINHMAIGGHSLICAWWHGNSLEQQPTKELALLFCTGNNYQILLRSFTKSFSYPMPVHIICKESMEAKAICILSTTNDSSASDANLEGNFAPEGAELHNMHI